jgi:hypothetical protein
MSDMFAVNVEGLRDLVGEQAKYRLFLEPVANVLDEYRGYDDRPRPTHLQIELSHQPKPRGIRVVYTDDGAGFRDVEDVWTLFGRTGKRQAPSVAGRFNAGDKYFFACARETVIQTGKTEVVFKGGKRTVRTKRTPFVGTRIESLIDMPKGDLPTIQDWLLRVKPSGLTVSINALEVEAPTVAHQATVTVPTEVLTETGMSKTSRKTTVLLYEEPEPWLYELGVPVCDISTSEFPFSLDVQQKVPLPMSRDMVTPAYLAQLLGKVVESAAMDGVALLAEDAQNSTHLKSTLDWVRDEDALKAVSDNVYGENAVSWSSDPMVNAHATARGATIIHGSSFTPETRKRLAVTGTLQTAARDYDPITVFSVQKPEAEDPNRRKVTTCPHCKFQW